MKPMKPKKIAKDELRKPAQAVTESSKPEAENDDTEAVPPGIETAEVEEETARERAADDGMPDEDAL
jgi:hypothetical protein